MEQLKLFEVERFDVYMVELKKLFKQSPVTWDINLIESFPKLYLRLLLYRFHQSTTGNKDQLIQRVKDFVAFAVLIKNNTIVINDDFQLRPAGELSKLKEIKPVLKRLHIKYSYLTNKQAILTKAVLYFKSCYSRKFIKKTIA